MRTAQIRQQLHEYIESAEDKKLKGFTAEQKKELDKRYDEYITGVGQNYTWVETVEMARQAIAKTKNK